MVPAFLEPLAEFLGPIDQNFNLWIEQFRTPEITHIFSIITYFADKITIVTGLIILSLIFIFEKRWKTLFYMYLCNAGGFLTTHYLKIFFERARPDNGMYFESTFSFPSNHSTMAVAFWGFLAYYMWQNSENMIFKIINTIVLITIILAIITSRLILQVHYLSDITAGLLIGLFWLILSILLLRTSQNHTIKKAAGN